MISPEAAEKGFHQREQETMHFKYSAKISEEINEGADTAALKAYYSSETNNGDS